MNSDYQPVKSIEKSEPVTKEISKIISKNIDSKIITFQHAEIISKWIDRLEITDMVKNLYEFKLLYRHSRDSLDSNFKKFHDKSNDNILSRVINEKNAINNAYYGPSFGLVDLYLFYSLGLRIRCKKTYYEKEIRENNDISYVEKFEVFQIA